MTVTKLQRKSNEEVVANLRQLLAQAENGDIIGMTFVALRRGRVHTIGRLGDVDERDLALAIHDLSAALATSRRERARQGPIDDGTEEHE